MLSSTFVNSTAPSLNATRGLRDGRSISAGEPSAHASGAWSRLHDLPDSPTQATNVFHFEGSKFEHADACRLSRRILQSFGVNTLATATSSSRSNAIVIDLSRAIDASTAAFAHLVVLRSTLLKHAADLHLTGLRDRAQKIYEVNRLTEVLPRQLNSSA